MTRTRFLSQGWIAAAVLLMPACRPSPVPPFAVQLRPEAMAVDHCEVIVQLPPFDHAPQESVPICKGGRGATWVNAVVRNISKQTGVFFDCLVEGVNGSGDVLFHAGLAPLFTGAPSLGAVLEPRESIWFDWFLTSRNGSPLTRSAPPYRAMCPMYEYCQHHGLRRIGSKRCS